MKSSYKNSGCDMVCLGDVIELNFGDRITKKTHAGTKYSVYGGGGASFATNNFNRENEYVIARFAMSENCVRYVSNKFWLLDSGATFSIKDDYLGKVMSDYIGKSLIEKQPDILLCARGAAQKNLDSSLFYKLKIPLPSIVKQKQIVNKIDQVENEIELLSNSYKEKKNYIDELKESIINRLMGFVSLPATGGGAFTAYRLDEICKLKRGTSITRKVAVKGAIPVIAGGRKPAYYHNVANRLRDTITVSGSGASAGFVNFFENPIYASDCTTLESADKKITSIKYIYKVLLLVQDSIYQLQRGGAQPHVYKSDLAKIKVPMPSLKIQNDIVRQIERTEKELRNAQEAVHINEEYVIELRKSIIHNIMNS